jgi:hypothetical protein
MRVAFLAMVSILRVAPLYAESELWVHVAGGAFVIQPKELERMQAGLESRVTEAAQVREATLPARNRYLIQYREGYVSENFLAVWVP